jgi:hypothetical protein
MKESEKNDENCALYCYDLICVNFQSKLVSYFHVITKGSHFPAGSGHPIGKVVINHKYKLPENSDFSPILVLSMLPVI